MGDLYEEKKRLYHKKRGSRCLEDETAEKVAYLLAVTDADDEAILSAYPDLTPESLEALKADEWFGRRLDYLRRRAMRDSTPQPQSPDEYVKFALRRLHKLAEGAKEERNQVAAAEKLGKLAHELKKEGPADKANKTMAPDTLSDLEKAFYPKDK